ncbi:hypothetical protein CHLNCDRAFT_138970 [Chlorella variabilis]|uniref:Dolichol phosphate-mannose biosynthesis regulatory protein n=1 Tax=Chlorella variabilis TaxID=554065 RepID=E1ZP24_CHLVA|nr:hypothetical protein CHLNCDRAFT_138970 [Chlorella variabilis]EFN52542.1 hypothetical protein CHLNCDRAFT_138970 [Chlorella variabilis]|eukprot:XP_005844644.1 hypothetical protein CHLNCDRAFT_138970 [Chlorella variabilis]
MVATALAGNLVLVAACALYAYYTAWVLVTSFVEEGQPILRLFPPRHFAIAAPVLAGVVLFGVTLCTLGGFIVSSELGKLRQQWAEAKAKAA